MLSKTNFKNKENFLKNFKNNKIVGKLINKRAKRLK